MFTDRRLRKEIFQRQIRIKEEWELLSSVLRRSGVTDEKLHTPKQFYKALAQHIKLGSVESLETWGEEIDKVIEQIQSSSIKAKSDLLTRVKESKQLRVGYCHYPPFCHQSVNDPDRADGLYVNLLESFCASQSINLSFEQIRFSSAIDFLLEDKADIVISIFQTPRRSRVVDFTAFLHTVSVSGVTRKKETRITSQSDLLQHPLTFVVCRGEIGHELLETSIKVPPNKVVTIDTSNIADIVAFVAAGKADIAIADSLSCQHALDARGAEGPLLKPVLRRRPLYLCQNGVMLPLNQDSLANWLDAGLKQHLKQPEFQVMENEILDRYNGIISKL